MAPLSEKDQRFTTVKTTLPATPYPPMETRPVIYSKRLFLRPYEATDIDALREMRLQPETMFWTSQGRPDGDLAETQAVLAKKLAPYGNDTYEMAICERETGRMIGGGGCILVGKHSFGWPTIGYMLRSDAAGKGYATEFVNIFLEAYWALPRRQVEIEVDSDMVEVDEQTGLVKECMGAVTLGENIGSQKVLQKTGWRKVKTWEEADAEESEQMTTLFAWMKHDVR